MNAKTVFVVLGLLLLAAATISAATLTAVPEKTVFVKGDNATVAVTIKNDAGAAAPQLFLIEASVRGGGLPPAPKRVPVQLAAGEEKTISIALLFVDDGVPPGDYAAALKLLAGESVASQASVSFSVTGTLRSIRELRASSCADAACAQPSIIFYKGGEVFLAASSSEEGITASVVVKTPSGGEVKFDALPASFKAVEVGAYAATVTASKQGFKAKTALAEFSVLEKPVTLVEEFQAAQASQGKAAVKPEEKQAPAQRSDYAVVGVVVAVIVVLALLFAWLKKKKVKRH